MAHGRHQLNVRYQLPHPLRWRVDPRLHLYVRYIRIARTRPLPRPLPPFSGAAIAAMHDQAAADDRLGVAGIDVLAAVRTDHPRADAVPTRLVQQVNWGGRESGPLVAPLHQGDVDGKQRAALGG